MHVQQRNAIKHSVEPMVQPVLDSMPSFNWTEFQDRHGISMPDMFKKDEKPRPGIKLRDMGYKPKHPIVIVPGFVTSGLELWAGKPCASRFFRCEPGPAPCSHMLDPNEAPLRLKFAAVVRSMMLQSTLQVLVCKEATIHYKYATEIPSLAQPDKGQAYL